MHNNNNLHTPPPLYVLNKVSACLYTHADTHLGTQTEKTQKKMNYNSRKTALQLRCESTQDGGRSGAAVSGYTAPLTSTIITIPIHFSLLVFVCILDYKSNYLYHVYNS